MKRFKNLVLAEEKELSRLWDEWTVAQQALVDFSKEVLGPKNPAGHVVEDEQGSMSRIEAEKLKLVEEIETMSKEAIERMAASEKVIGILTWK